MLIIFQFTYVINFNRFIYLIFRYIIQIFLIIRVHLDQRLLLRLLWYTKFFLAYILIESIFIATIRVK